MIYDVIVVGGGHAGVEAASAAERMGGIVLLITINIDTIAQLSCNPSIGGIGKSQLVKEIDALGGLIGRGANYSGIHFKTLNKSKGSAVQSTRIQVDKNKYKKFIIKKLIKQKNLYILQQEVIDILPGKIIKIKTKIGEIFYSKSIILTLGTFLKGLIHIGNKKIKSGRFGEKSTTLIETFFQKNNISTKRFKTGTPPRIDKRSINYKKIDIQESEIINNGLSFYQKQSQKHIPCYITYTNNSTHNIIKKNINLSYMYSDKNIKSKGPRYCPSIEDKVIKFETKNQHQIFLEEEGKDYLEIYPNGLSNSFPYIIQKKFIKSINGLENAILTRPGYAIEYDFINTKELHKSLNHKKFKNIFFAGQINGTTGYEEAASQGLIAGINAFQYSQNLPLWIPSRKKTYIGVLLDDLISLEIKEPYRMFTARAEYRLNLREDNADFRLSKIGRKLNVLSKKKYKLFKLRKKRINKIISILKNTIYKNKKLSDMIKSNYSYQYLIENKLLIHNIKLTNIDILYIESKIKYSGYIKREKKKINKNKNISYIIPKDINFNIIDSLSNEIKENIENEKISKIEQIKNLPGITPAGINAIINYLLKKKYEYKKKK